MKNVRMIARVFLYASILLSVGTQSFAEPMNLDLLKQELITYHDSGAYEKDVAAVAAAANQYITSQVTANNQSNPQKKLAVVLDIDETVLSNYNGMIERKFNDDKLAIDKSILRANAPALTPMLNLYNNLLKQKVAIFFVTGRSEQLKEATERNLKNAGYKEWSGLFLKPKAYNVASIVPFKTQARNAIAQKGYTIIASIGDQNSDLIGGNAIKSFKLPNPYYYLS